jgi:hypothetical protein
MEVNYMLGPGIKSKERKQIYREMNLQQLEKAREYDLGKRRERMVQEIKIVYKLGLFISDYFGCDVSKDTRKREILIKRQIAHFFAKELKLGSLESIGQSIGGVEHATIYNSISIVEHLISYNRSISNAFSIKSVRTNDVVTKTRSFKSTDRFNDLIEDLRAYIKLKFNQNQENEN